MTEEMIALARRAVACKGFRWMPGMRTVNAMRVIHDEALFPGRPCAIREGGWVDTAPPRPLGDDLPDLTDPATVGCLLALVREAWGICEVRTGFRWCVVVRPAGGGRRYLYGSTEAEALVAALESPP